MEALKAAFGRPSFFVLAESLPAWRVRARPALSGRRSSRGKLATGFALVQSQMGRVSSLANEATPEPMKSNESDPQGNLGSRRRSGILRLAGKRSD
jgi:hypothetical protein